MLKLPHLSSLAKILKKPIFIIDLETTGFRNPGIVEFACLKAMDNGRIVYKSTLVDPEVPIDYGASKVHGIYQRDVVGAKIFSEHIDFVHTMYTTGVMSGFNIATYDLRVIDENAKRYNSKKLPKASVLDLRDFWKKVSGSTKGKLVDLAAHYCIPVENAHRALGDVLMTAKIMDKMLHEHGVNVAASLLKEIKY